MPSKREKLLATVYYCMIWFCNANFTLCVAGVRKLTLRTPMVTTTEKVTNIIVKSKYFPRRGTAKEVGGMISARSRKNTVNESKMEIDRDT